MYISEKYVFFENRCFRFRTVQNFLVRKCSYSVLLPFKQVVVFLLSSVDTAFYVFYYFLSNL